MLTIDRYQARRIITEYCDVDAPQTIVDDVIAPALEAIGDGWEQGTYSLAQVYMAGRICEELADDLLPPATSSGHSGPRVAIGVLDDYHMLGKRMVRAILHGAAIDAIDYGRCEAWELASRAQNDDIDILMISTLMLPAALAVEDVRRALTAEGIRPWLVVGGAPFRLDPDLYHRVGADRMGTSASDAIRIVRELEGALPDR